MVTANAGIPPAAMPTPSSDGTVTLADYAISLPAAITPGPHVWRVVNTGQRPHELRILKAPRPLTEAQVLAALQATNPEQPTPAGGLDCATLASLPAAGGLGWLSPGQPAWAAVDLAPGYYIALDLIRSPSVGFPYAEYGMVAVFTIGGSGAATPGP